MNALLILGIQPFAFELLEVILRKKLRETLSFLAF